MTSVTERGAGGLGLLGGTFDPPHIGHIRAAVRARHALGLDGVLFVPAGDPWQKRETRVITPAATRLEMVRAAVVGVPGLEVSDIEVRRAGPSYTIDTVEELRAAVPDRAIIVILGADAAALVPTWERPQELLARVPLAVVARPGAALPVLPGADVVPVAIERLDVSSSQLRADVGAGRPIDGLVAPGVAEIIHRRQLYRA